MPKMKTQSAAKKRFRLTGSGKLVRRRAFRTHLMEAKSAKRKRSFRKAAMLSKADTAGVKKLLGLK
ncbi:MAG: 50S ribosomal protein L35 [Actinobacteria bacterium]|jgi:large subunit ribosomal protein L35|nr:50S ribosomal protein L35 [Actinomycetota bacterium]